MRNLIGIASKLLIVFLMAEAITYVAMRTSLRIPLRAVVYDPPVEKVLAEYDEYMARRHPVLGWPSPLTFGGPDLDESGSRHVPSFPKPGGACVSLYGDSFAYSDEVDAEHAWGNVLSKLLGCRVANYGMNGYGVDQAYIRFQRNVQDEAPLVIFLIHPQNAMRSVNQFRALTTGEGTYLSFKPRFILNGRDELEFVPLPTFSKAEMEALLKDPGAYLPHEYFLPGTSAGPVPLRFPYTGMMFRLLGNAQVRAGVRTVLTGYPSWADYVRPGNPSGSFEVITHILEAFVRDAAARGKKLVILILPSVSAVAYFHSDGEWVYQPVIDYMAARNVDVGNLGPAFLAELGDRPFVEISSSITTGGGHFTEEGYEMLARFVLAVLTERGLKPTPVPATSPPR